MATVDFKQRVTNIALAGDRSLWLKQFVYTPHLIANIHRQELKSLVNKILLVGFAGAEFQLIGSANITQKIRILATSTQSNTVVGILQLPRMKLSANADRAVGVVGNAQISRFVTMSASTSEYTENGLTKILSFIRPNFGMQASAFSEAQNTALNYTIVLNLRTKAHWVYDATTLNATATTGEILFGTYKNKNISDIFVLGRSVGAIEIDAINDESTRRNYIVTYKEGEQQALKNKKVKLAKGLSGTNWQFKLANQDTTFAEIRSLDIFVNELKRHV